MKYTKISPLGWREGPGTFDSIYDNQKYKTIEEAIAANDIVVIHFVLDENDLINFEVFHSAHPEDKEYQCLQIQHFPAGIDIFDDYVALGMAEKLIEKYK
jgi:hypothetical protein